MKLLGYTNWKEIVASVGHHDYVTNGEDSESYIMADGGQDGCTGYAGYRRFAGIPVWFEVPETFADLYNDYQFNFGPKKKRKFGIWKLKKVRLLTWDEIPKVDSLEWKKVNCVWGARGILGDQPLKYIHLVDAETSHLKKIAELRISEEMLTIIGSILKDRIAKRKKKSK